MSNHLKIRHIEAGNVFVYDGVPYLKIDDHFYDAVDLQTYKAVELDVDLYATIRMSENSLNGVNNE